MSFASRKVVNCDFPWISRAHVGGELENRVTCMLLEEGVGVTLEPHLWCGFHLKGLIQQAM